MKNWTQILVFVILSLILGFILGRVTGNKEHHPGIHKKVMHLGDDHERHEIRWHDKDGGTLMIIEEDEDEMTLIVEGLESVGFEGDTIIDGANINITRDGDEVRVEVKKEMAGEGSGKRIEKRIEKHMDKD
jgi:hypothetical protein